MADEQLLATIDPTIFFEVVDAYPSSTGRFGISFGTREEAGSMHLLSTLSGGVGDSNMVMLLSKLRMTTPDDVSGLHAKVPPFTPLRSRQKGRVEPYPHIWETITVLHKDEDCKVVGITVGEEKPIWGTISPEGVGSRTPIASYRIHDIIGAYEQRWGPDVFTNNIVALVEPGAMRCYLWVLEALGYRGDLHIRIKPLNLITTDRKTSSVMLLSVPIQRECGPCLESELCLATPFLGHLPEEFIAGGTEIVRLPYALAKKIAASDEWAGEVSIIIGSKNGASYWIEQNNTITQWSETGVVSFEKVSPPPPIREGVPDSRAYPVVVTMPGCLCSERPLPGSQLTDYADRITVSITSNSPDDDEVGWDWRDFFIDLGADPMDSLIAKLSGDDIVTRWKAAWALGDIGDPRAIEPLIAAYLAEKEGPYLYEVPPYNLKMVIGYVLGTFKDPRAVDALIQEISRGAKEINRKGDLMYGAHDNIKAVAAWALGEIGDTRAIPCLEKASKMSVDLWPNDEMGFVDASTAEIAVLSEIYGIFDSGNPIENALMKLQEMQRSA